MKSVNIDYLYYVNYVFATRLEEKKLEVCSLQVLKKFSLFSFRLCQENPKSNANALLVSIFHVISIGDVSMSIAIQNIVLYFDSVEGIVAIQKKKFQ